MKKIIVYTIVLSFSLSGLVWRIPGVEATANHLVISEVQTSGASTTDDFIEIYNPTDQAINLDSYRLAKRTQSGTTDTSIKSFGASDEIPAFGFYLWANSSYSSIATAPDVTTTQSVADDNGIAIQKYNSVNDLWEVIDSVGWGGATNSFVEISAYPGNLLANTSIERSPGATNPSKGNGDDSENNSSDFSLLAIPDPQNSASTIEIPEGMALPSNLDPVAVPGDGQIVATGSSVDFDGSASYDSDGTIVEYLWGFGDLTTGTGSVVSHTYDTAGYYTVSLRVTDDLGAQHIGFTSVQVADSGSFSPNVLINEFLPAPGSTTDWDSSGVADFYDEWIELINIGADVVDLSGWLLDDTISGGSFYFEIESGTTIDPGAVLVFYQYDTDIVLNNSGDTVTLMNPIGGINDQYSYTSTATDQSYSRPFNDSDNNFVTSYVPSPGELNPIPPNELPIANAGNDIVAYVGDSVSFSGSGSSDSDGTIVSYSWNFGDGNIATGVSASNTYSSEGQYTATLTVVDNRDGSDIDERIITVNPAPSAPSSPPLAPEQQAATSGDVGVSEILPDPTGADAGTASISGSFKILADSGEYIKLKNFDNKKINIKGWKIDDVEGGSNPFVIGYDLVLAPGEEHTFYRSETKITLNNDGDSVRLFGIDGNVVNIVSYVGPVPEGEAYILSDKGWVWSSELVAKDDIVNIVDSDIVEDVDTVVPDGENIEKIDATDSNTKAFRDPNIYAPIVPELTQEPKKIALAKPITTSPLSSSTASTNPDSTAVEEEASPIIIDLGNAIKPYSQAEAESTDGVVGDDGKSSDNSYVYEVSFFLLIALLIVVWFVITPKVLIRAIKERSHPKPDIDEQAIKELFGDSRIDSDQHPDD